jgi:hypothetical protein
VTMIEAYPVTPLRVTRSLCSADSDIIALIIIQVSINNVKNLHYKKYNSVYN